MSEQSAILVKLASLTTKDDVFKNGYRVIGAELDPMIAILREIDDTVLERTLIFWIGDARVSAVVAGRRLRGIVEIDGDVPNADAVVGEVLSLETPDTMATVGTILADLATGDAKVTVASTPVKPLGTSADAGVTINALARSWGIDLDARPASALTRFLTANAAAISASLHITSDQDPCTTGDASVLEAIMDVQVTPFRKRHRSILGKTDGPMLICLDGAVDGQPLALAIADGEQCLINYDSDALSALLRSWNAITGD